MANGKLSLNSKNFNFPKYLDFILLLFFASFVPPYTWDSIYKWEMSFCFFHGARTHTHSQYGCPVKWKTLKLVFCLPTANDVQFKQYFCFVMFNSFISNDFSLFIKRYLCLAHPDWSNKETVSRIQSTELWLDEMRRRITIACSVYFV